MRKSGSAVILLLGYANSVDAMSRVRRGDMGWNKWFGSDDSPAEDATTATTTVDPFDDSFFNDSDDDTFAASAIINVEADVAVEAEGQAEADVEVEADGQVKIGARAFGGPLTGGISGRPVHTTQQPTTRLVHTHAPYVCDNGGTWNHSLQRCNCLSGFTGIWCNRVDNCPTCYRGTCQVTNGVAKCVCHHGWDLSDCRRHNCNGNGFSEVVNGQAQCNCQIGWSGDLCQEKIIVVNGDKCRPNGVWNGSTCVCNLNYSGQWCEQYNHPPVRTCSLDCTPGVCQMGTTSAGDYCNCNAGYFFTGSSCALRLSCATKQCGNNQYCIMTGNTPTCQCVFGYSGPSCNTPTSCATKVCTTNKKCVMSSGIPTCVCPAGWTGDNCTVRAACTRNCPGGYCQWSGNAMVCIAYETCNKNCGTYGTCVGIGASSTCQCRNGYTGEFCNIQPCNKTCGANGTCVGNGLNSTCQCRNGYTGEYCNIPSCPQNCNGRGTCNNGVCICTSGWSGAACQNRDCTLNCGNNGACAFSSSGTEYCNCNTGFSGSSCTPLSCTRNCNNGQCVFNADYTSQSCVCNDGYTGENCENGTRTACDIDGRGTSPCQNDCQCTLKTPAICEDCEYTCTNIAGNSFLGGKCQYEEPTLTCMTEMIQVQVDQALINDWEKNSLSAEWGAALFHGTQYNDAKCQYSRISTSNGDYAITISAADWTKCGGAVSVQNGMLTVSNKVSRDVTHSVISFFEPVFDWTCQYQIAVANGVVGPPPPRRPIQIVEQHNFNIRMKFYCDPREDVNRQELQSLNGNAVIMTDQVFVNIDLSQLNQFQHLPTMGMRLGDCTAETGFGDQAEKFTIIRNGCPTSIGLTNIEYRTDREIEFKFNNFVDRRGIRGSTQVKISCEIRMCGQSCSAQPVCSSRRRRGIPEIDSELELLESGLFEDSEILSVSETEESEELSVKNIELFDTVLYMDIEDIIPMQNSTNIITEN